MNDVLRLSMNIARGESGTCNGDSGGPIFYEDPELGLVQVSLVSGGDAVCRATNTGRVHSRTALDFIGVGTVQGDVSAVVCMCRQPLRLVSRGRSRTSEDQEAPVSS